MSFSTFWNPVTGGCLNLLGGPVGTNRCGMTIGGGEINTVTAPYSTIVGGCINTVSACFSSILGGCSNSVSHCYSAVFGCNLNSVCACTLHSHNFAAMNMPGFPGGPAGTFYTVTVGTTNYVAIN